MILIWGSRLYGRVDQMPGDLHVATKFGHLWYIPLIPMGSTLIIEQMGNQYRGVPIPLSLKSVMLAWLRAALIVFGAASLIAGIGMLADKAGPRHANSTAAVVEIVVGVLMLGMSWGIRRIGFFRRASYTRAVQLAEKAGMSEEGLILLEAAYGRISEEEAKKALEEMAGMNEAAAREIESATPPPIRATPPTTRPVPRR